MTAVNTHTTLTTNQQAPPTGQNPTQGQIVKISKPLTVPVYTWVYFFLLGLYLFVSLALIIVGLSTAGLSFKLLGYKWSVGGGIILVTVAHFIYAVFLPGIHVHQNGGVTFLGMAILEMGSYSGRVPLPFRFLTSLGTATREIMQREFPGDPEETFKGTDEQYDKLDHTEKQKYKRPLRFITGGPKAGAGRQVTEDNIQETSQVVTLSWHVVIQIQWYFAFTAAFRDVEKLWAQIDDTGKKILAEHIGQKNPKEIKSGVDNINAALLNALKEKLCPLGVAVIDVGIHSPDLGKTVSDSLRDITAAKAERISGGVKADLEAYTTTQKGLAEAEVIQAKVAAEGRGVHEYVGAIGTGKTAKMVIAARTAEAAAKGGKVVILGDGGMSSLASIATVVKNALEAQTESAPKGAPK